jgi:hypothetical protein
MAAVGPVAGDSVTCPPGCVAVPLQAAMSMDAITSIENHNKELRLIDLFSF